VLRSIVAIYVGELKEGKYEECKSKHKNRLKNSCELYLLVVKYLYETANFIGLNKGENNEKNEEKLEFAFSTGINLFNDEYTGS